MVGIVPPRVTSDERRADRWMGHQPRADLEVGAGGRNFLSCCSPAFEFSTKIQAF